MKSGLIALILVLCVTLTILFPAVAEDASHAAAQSQIERAVVSYAATGTRDEQALSALASLDETNSEKWVRIMETSG